jgi:hypothetical protein
MPESPVQRRSLEGRTVFLSASIPDPERWHGAAWDPLKITDAVVAIARSVLGHGGVLVTAAHPTIAPLLLYVQRDLPNDDMRSAVRVFQSSYFSDKLPDAIASFSPEAIEFVPIRTSGDHTPDLEASLLYLRAEMFERTQPIGAFFVGGMQGILDEHALLKSRGRTRLFPLRDPGGAGSELELNASVEDFGELLASDVYPRIAEVIVSWLCTV